MTDYLTSTFRLLIKIVARLGVADKIGIKVVEGHRRRIDSDPTAH